jgi:aspartate racemase
LNAGAELILPVCNTIDIFAPDIADLTPTPVLSLPVLAGFEGTRRGYERLGVLSSRTARKMNLHARVLSALDMETVITTEAEQTRVDTLIAHLMGASTDERTQAQAELFALGTGLLARGAESVIVGCTELSMIARAQWEWIDTTALAVDAALAFAYNKQVLSVCA